jgi:S-adenosyl-L-methionine hydrolase (adenosine-forming)
MLIPVYPGIFFTFDPLVTYISYRMPIITLLSDWGLTDHYVASVKGAILSRTPDAVIVDISHNIRLFDIKHASFVMRNAWRSFPAGTIHIIGIDSIESDKHPHIIVQSEGHYFIGADTGLISLILDEKPERIISISVTQDSGYFTFPSRDRFVKVATMIAKGTPLEELGEPLQALNPKTLLQPHFDGKTISGKVMHIDNYENVYVNISDRFARECIGNKPYTIVCRRDIFPLVKAYGDVREGNLCALYASNGLLQLSVNRGKVASLQGIAIDTEVLLVLGNE